MPNDPQSPFVTSGLRIGTPAVTTRGFKVPPLDLRSPGLHMVLFTDNLGSLDVGSPILYKQVKVGSVQSYQFSRKNKQLVIGVHIEKEYENLVNGSKIGRAHV